MKIKKMENILQFVDKNMKFKSKFRICAFGHWLERSKCYSKQN